MCFSASASFTAAATLGIIGSYTLAKHHTKRDIMIAATPLIFGVQQAVEGVIWLSQTGYTIPGTPLLPYFYLFFAYFLWPFWIPLALYIKEEMPAVAARLFPLTILGGLVAGSNMLLTLVTQPTVMVHEHHIYYANTIPAWLYWPLGIAYVIAVLAPFILSSVAGMRLFGMVLFGSCLASLFIFYVTFTSTWCFFAALLSACLLFILKKE